MWEKVGVLYYATQIQEIAAEILEHHMVNNNGKESVEFEINLERDVIDCFIPHFKLKLIN